MNGLLFFTQQFISDYSGSRLRMCMKTALTMHMYFYTSIVFDENTAPFAVHFTGYLFNAVGGK